MQSQRRYSATQRDSISNQDLFNSRAFMCSLVTSCVSCRNVWCEILLPAKCDTAFAHPWSDSSFQAPPGLGVELNPAWVFMTGRGHEQKGNSLEEHVLLGPEEAIGPLGKLLLLRLNLECSSLRNLSLASAALIITQPSPPAATGLGER